jgi:hypothetical protein
MPEYSVLIPCTMSVNIIVEAGSKEEALSKAFDASFSVKIDEGAECVDICDFETHEKIIKGNVFYGCQNETEVNLIED